MTLRAMFLQLICFTLLVFAGLIGSAYYFYGHLEDFEKLFDSVTAIDSDLDEMRSAELEYFKEGLTEKVSLFEKSALDMEHKIKEIMDLSENSIHKELITGLDNGLKSYKQLFIGAQNSFSGVQALKQIISLEFEGMNKGLNSIKNKLALLRSSYQMEGADLSVTETDMLTANNAVISTQKEAELLMLKAEQFDLKGNQLKLKSVQDVSKAESLKLVLFAEKAGHKEVVAHGQAIQKNWEVVIGKIGEIIEITEQMKEENKNLDSSRQNIAKLSEELKATFEKEKEQTKDNALKIISGIVLVGIAFLIIGSVILYRSFGKQINKMVQDLSHGATQVNSASNEVAAASNRLAQGASSQAAAIEEVTAAIEDVATLSGNNAIKAKQATLLAETGSKAVSTAQSDMKNIGYAMKEIKERGSEISQIIQSIDEIAFQTNLLALNAAVEAARAGDSGRGFAVVADEVRSLAQRAADSASKTQNLINNAIQQMDIGSSLTQKAEKGFESVVKSFTELDTFITEVSMASSSEAQSVAEVKKSVASVGQVVQENASVAEETAAASAELDTSSKHMLSLVNDLSRMV